MATASSLHNLGLIAFSRAKLRTARRLLLAAERCYAAMEHQRGVEAVRRNLALLEG
ncbi:MAG: hypothetical protein AB4911_16630 [Oscillochloridaceae bacterium umkhey_bin13]